MRPLHSAFLDELTKIAALKTELLPHQQRVVERIGQKDQPGLIVAHGLGSGKTLTSIAAHHAHGGRGAVVVPAALQANYKKEQKKHLTKALPTSVSSMQLAAREGTPPKGEFLVVDEAHRARDAGSKTWKALEANEAEKRLLLTGSPFYNHPSDIAPLINLAAGDTIVPHSRESFSDKYVAKREVSPGLWKRLQGIKPGVVEELNPKRKKEIGGILNKWVDYHPGSEVDFPTVSRADVPVDMTDKQYEVYNALLGKAPPWVRAKVEAGLPLSAQESKDLNAFSNAARQVSNTTEGYQPGREVHAPKIDEAFRRLQEHMKTTPEGRAVIYSNYLSSGVNPYKARLEEAKIPYGEFTGQMSPKKRNEMVSAYNEGKLPVLLLSSAGGEGLDLKGTRLMQLLEPHWNLEKLKQVEGRGARYKSHADLPEDQRNLTIERYLAKVPKQGILQRLGVTEPAMGIDEYIRDRAHDKEKLISQFRDLLAKPDARQVAE